MIKKKSVKEDKRKNYKPVWEENEGVRQGDKKNWEVWYVISILNLRQRC